MRFKTNQADGLLLYADGNQGDYYILELMRGRLYFHIDLGKKILQFDPLDFAQQYGSVLNDLFLKSCLQISS